MSMEKAIHTVPINSVKLNSACNQKSSIGTFNASAPVINPKAMPTARIGQLSYGCGTSLAQIT